MDEVTVQTLLDRAQIEETVLRYGRSADERDWEALISCLTKEVDVDYTSLTGGEPERIAARGLVLERWAPTFESLDATQHFTGPCTVSVDGDGATAVAYFQAQHVLNGATGGEKWTLGGRYDFGLVRAGEDWSISAVTMTAMWDDGNRDILAQAAARR